MKRSNKIAAVVLATLGLGLAVAGAQAQPGSMGGGMGPGMMGGMHGMHGAMGQGAMGPGAMGPGAMGQGAMGSRMAGQQLMTPEERTAMQEKMRSAATPEERQKIAEANHAEMQKRATEKGITLPEKHGPHHGMGPNAGRPKQ